MAGSSSLLFHRGQQARGPFVQWNPDAKSRAPANVALQFNSAAVRAHDPLHDHQSKSRALFLCGVERVENAVDLLLRDAAAFSTRSTRSEEHTSELQSHLNLVCRLLLEKKKKDI